MTKPLNTAFICCRPTLCNFCKR